MDKKIKLEGIIQSQGVELEAGLHKFNCFTFGGNDDEGHLLELKIYEDTLYNDVYKLAIDREKKLKITIEEL